MIIFSLFITVSIAQSIHKLQGTELGFDSLRFKPMGRIFKSEYNNNVMTPDGKFQIPDDAMSVSIHNNKMDITSKIDYHWQNSSNYVFDSVSVSAHASFLGVGISGSYTEQKINFKMSQMTDMTAMVTTKFSTKLYSVQNDIYSTRLIDNVVLEAQAILYELSFARDAMASYMMQKFLSAYGDTVLTSVVYGGTMMTYSIIDQSYITTYSEETTMQTGTLGFNAFFGGVSGSVIHNTQDKNLLGFLQSSKFFDGETHGGRIKDNLTVEEFYSSIIDDGEVAPIDATGINICEIFSVHHFPNNTFSELLSLQKLCNKNRDLYLDTNLPLGCTNSQSPNYNPDAVRDDGSCKAPKNNYSFFGAYQTCVPVSGTDTCDEYVQKNPKTNDYTCYSSDPMVGDLGYISDIIISSVHQINTIPLAQYCGGLGNINCVYENINTVTAESNEVFIDSYTKCTGGTSYPSLGSAGCGQACHRVWFHHDCNVDCSSIWYNFNMCDYDFPDIVDWCFKVYNVTKQCYDSAKNDASVYFYGNVWNKKIGHIIDTHICAPKYNDTIMNNANIIGYNVLGFFTNTINNPVSRSQKCPTGATTMNLMMSPMSNDYIRLCISDDNTSPFSIPFGGIATCQQNNPFITPNRLDCDAGYTRYYTTLNGLCETLICLDTRKLSASYSIPVIRELPFMAMPNDGVSIIYPKNTGNNPTSTTTGKYLTISSANYMINGNVNHLTTINYMKIFKNITIDYRQIPIINQTQVQVPLNNTNQTVIINYEDINSLYDKMLVIQDNITQSLRIYENGINADSPSSSNNKDTTKGTSRTVYMVSLCVAGLVVMTGMAAFAYVSTHRNYKKSDNNADIIQENYRELA